VIVSDYQLSRGLTGIDAIERLRSAFPNPIPARSRRFVWDPEHWRFRAEEARTVADQMTHEEARTIMRRIAMDYDRLAKLAEVQLIQEAIDRNI
jgi:hypothetical protein